MEKWEEGMRRIGEDSISHPANRCTGDPRGDTAGSPGARVGPDAKRPTTYSSQRVQAELN